MKLLLKNQMSFSPFPCQAKILGIQTIWGLLSAGCTLLLLELKVTSRDICLHLVVRKNSLVFPRLDFLGRQWTRLFFFFFFTFYTQYPAWCLVHEGHLLNIHWVNELIKKTAFSVRVAYILIHSFSKHLATSKSRYTNLDT